MDVWNRVKSLVIQPDIASSESGNGYSNADVRVYNSMETIGIVARCVEVITDAASEVPLKVFKVVDSEQVEAPDSILGTFLRQPNTYYDANQFYAKLISDLLKDGNAFIFIDKTGMYHAPAEYMEIIEDSKK